jgi:hypothetical protein
MAEAEVLNWEVEPIPDADKLYLRVHSDHLQAGELHPGVFRQRGARGMSVDWQKYATPEESIARSGASDKTKVGIVALVVGIVRTIPGLDARHDPDVERRNRAHSLVTGMIEEYGDLPAKVRKTMIRSMLFEKFSEWAVPPLA